MSSAPTFADRPTEPMVGETWAYRSRVVEPPAQVIVEKIGVKRPKRIRVRFVEDESEGRQEWVPPARLKVPWRDIERFLEWEERWDAVVGQSPDRDSAELDAAGVVFELLIEANLADLGYNATAGVAKIFDASGLAAYLAIDPDALRAHPLSFPEGRCLVAPWPVARLIATLAAARYPDVIMRYVAKEEADALRERALGRYSRPLWRFDDGFTPPEVCAAIDDEHGKPVREVLRAWSGQEAVGLSDELRRMRAELRRVSSVAESVVAVLRRQGLSREAARIERELGIVPARTEARPGRRRPPVMTKSGT